MPGRHAAQFRHLFALFARNRIRHRDAAIARQAADYVFTSSESESDGENVENNGQRRNNAHNQSQDRKRPQYYIGPDDGSFVIFCCLFLGLRNELNLIFKSNT